MAKTRTPRTEKHNTILDEKDIEKMLVDIIRELTGINATDVRAQIPKSLNVYYNRLEDKRTGTGAK